MPEQPLVQPGGTSEKTGGSQQQEGSGGKQGQENADNTQA